MIKLKNLSLENFGTRKVIEYGFLIIIALIMIQFLGMTNRFIFFQGGDNAAYFALARSIVENHSYSNIFTYPIIPHTQYPFMFPLLISTVIFFFGENILLIKIIIIAGSAVLMAGSTALIWQDREKNYLPLIITLLVGTVPFTLLCSARLLSEIPYTAFSCLTILFAERSLKINSIKNYNFILCILFCIISYFTRTIGITLFIALIIATMSAPPIRINFKQNCLKATAIALPFFFTAGVWYIRGLILTGGQIKGYLQQFPLKNTYLVDSPNIGIIDIIERITTGAVLYSYEIAESLLPFSSDVYNEKYIIYGSIIFFIITLGLITAIRKRRGVPEFYLIIYIIVMLAWGFYEKRFLIPIFPFMIYYLIKGIEIILVSVLFPFSQKFRLHTKDALIICLTLIMLYSNIPENIQTLKAMHKLNNSKGFEINPFFHIIGTNKNMIRMLSLAVFIRKHSEPNEIILARKSSLIYLASGHPTIEGPFSQDPEEFIRNLEQNNISYIILDEVVYEYSELKRASASVVNAYPDKFRIAYRIPDSDSIILKFLSN